MRRDDWLVRLERLIADAEGKSFAWGQHDCCTFAMDAVEAVTGTHPLPGLRGSYDTRFGAQRRMTEQGFENLEHALDVHAGTRRATPRMAQRGDVALVAPFAVGVVDGAGLVACLNADACGLVRLPPSEILAAWGA